MGLMGHLYLIGHWVLTHVPSIFKTEGAVKYGMEVKVNLQ